MVNRGITQSAFSRVWSQEFGPGPNRPLQYEGLWMAGSLDWSLGDVTKVEIPDPNEYGGFLTAGKIVGERGNPTLPITARYTDDATSLLLRMARNGCNHNLQVRMGQCANPQDTVRGWHKIGVLTEGRPTTYGTTALGALASAGNEVVNEEVPFDGDDWFEIVRIQFSAQAGAEVVQEVIDTIICDAVTCGQCGIPSNGCDVVLALTLTAGGSPGLPAEIIFTPDGGATFGDTLISTLAANEDPNEFACVGGDVVVVSEDDEALHFAPLADILAGTETWTRVATGFVIGNGPLAIHNENARQTWIVAENGYIYHSTGPANGVTIQDPGVATTDNLNSVHAYDIENVLAGGDNGALVVTTDGGENWTLVTTNAAILASDINTVWMTSKETWWVGLAAGTLFFTLDTGLTWTEKTFPGSTGGVVRDIHFANETVGYLAHDLATPAGRILRTVDGGNEWYVAPEDNYNIPANDRINAVAPCLSDVNIVWGGGLADDAVDGIWVKGDGPSG